MSGITGNPSPRERTPLEPSAQKAEFKWNQEVKSEGGQTFIKADATIQGKRYKVTVGFNQENLRGKYEDLANAGPKAFVDTMKKIVESLEPEDIVKMAGAGVSSTSLSDDTETSRVSLRGGATTDLAAVREENPDLARSITNVVTAFQSSNVSKLVRQGRPPPLPPEPDKAPAPPPEPREAPPVPREPGEAPAPPPEPIDPDAPPNVPTEPGPAASPPPEPKETPPPGPKITVAKVFTKKSDEATLREPGQRDSAVTAEPAPAPGPSRRGLRGRLGDQERFVMQISKTLQDGKKISKQEAIEAFHTISSLAKEGTLSFETLGPTEEGVPGLIRHTVQGLVDDLIKTKAGKSALSNAKVKQELNEYVQSQREMLNRFSPKVGDDLAAGYGKQKTARNRAAFLTQFNQVSKVADRTATLDEQIAEESGPSIPAFSKEAVSFNGNIPKGLPPLLKEIYTTEENFSAEMFHLIYPTWAPEGSKKDMTFFQRLEFEGAISKAELALLESQWDVMIGSTEEIMKGLRVLNSETASPEEKVAALINAFSPDNVNDHLRNLGALVVKQQEMTAILEKISTSKKGQALLQKFRAGNSGKGLDMVLINPTQRGPRYKLLLEGALKQCRSAGMNEEALQALSTEFENLKDGLDIINSLTPK